MKIVLVFTSTRADFGLLNPLIKQLQTNQDVKTVLFVTGTHLDEKFGLTISEIKKSFPDLERLEVRWTMDSSVSHHQLSLMANSFSLFAKSLENKKIDLAIVLGDRFETFCFASVCATLKIPLAHLHGGELTFGALDDKYRHCITKLSELHFVSAEKYRERVIQLGESPNKVFDVGALGVENSLVIKLRTLEELASATGLKLTKNVFMMTFHPETNAADFGIPLFKLFLEKLAAWLKTQSDFCVVASGTNVDQGGEHVRQMLDVFGHTVGDKFMFVESLGAVNYLSMVKNAIAILGNSSSGVIEANSLGTPTVNVGFRQDGRECDPTVIQISGSKDLAKFDFSQVVGLKKGNSSWDKSIYFKPETSRQMANHIYNFLNHSMRTETKKFYDLNTNTKTSKTRNGGEG